MSGYLIIINTVTNMYSFLMSFPSNSFILVSLKIFTVQPKCLIFFHDRKITLEIKQLPLKKIEC